jgi:RHS repeat-associated protein
VVDVAHEDATPLRYAYRDDGALSEASLDDRATRFDCDPRGRIVAEHGEDGTVEIQRDRAGRVIVVRGPHGVRVEYIRDAAGRIAKVVACTETARWEATRSYDAAGGLIDTQLPGGIRSYWWRDAAGRPTQHYVGTDDRSLRLRRYTWSASGRLQQLDEEGMPPEIVRYDVWGRSLADAPTVEHVFDEDGRVIECPVEAGTLTLQWDDADQLRSVTGSDGRVSSATYDAFGRRLARDDDGRVTRWLWVGDLPLLQWEPDASAPILWVFDPDTFEPLARLCGPQTWSIVADQRRAPLCLLDARGELAWSSQGDRLGRGPITGDASLCPWRLCGQLEDPTGLRDNRWRSFDPRAGRYLAPDPLGLRAGLDVYAYVDDPRTQVDPRGLLPCGAGPAGGGDPTADLDLDPRPRSFAADRRGRAPAFRG